MFSPPDLSADALSTPAFAQRIALSVLATEIDELLHRRGEHAFPPPASHPADPASHHLVPVKPQPTHSS